MHFDPMQPPVGQRYFFHYTDCASAHAIAEDGVFMVRKPGRFAPGMYVTDVVPDDGYLEEVEPVAFDGAPPELTDGVVVIVDSDPAAFFEENEPGNWSSYAAEWDDVDLQGLILAVGCFDDGRWSWQLTEH